MKVDVTKNSTPFSQKLNILTCFKTLYYLNVSLKFYSSNARRNNAQIYQCLYWSYTKCTDRSNVFSRIQRTQLSSGYLSGQFFP